MVYAPTSHNRTVCASGPKDPSASAMARSFRYASFPRHCSGTVCRPWSLLRKALIRAAKPSHTAGTLCEIERRNYCSNSHYQRNFADRMIFHTKIKRIEDKKPYLAFYPLFCVKKSLNENYCKIYVKYIDKNP
jgi:hypothetical protein